GLSDLAHSTQIVEPLVLRIVIHADDVEILWPATQFGIEPATQQVPGLELGKAVGFGSASFLGMPLMSYHINYRIYQHEAGTGGHGPDGSDGLDDRPHEMSFQFRAPVGDEREHGAFVARGPREKGNFVDGHEQIWAGRFIGQPLGKSRAE